MLPSAGMPAPMTASPTSGLTAWMSSSAGGAGFTPLGLPVVPEE